MCYSTIAPTSSRRSPLSCTCLKRVLRVEYCDLLHVTVLIKYIRIHLITTAIQRLSLITPRLCAAVYLSKTQRSELNIRSLPSQTRAPFVVVQSRLHLANVALSECSLITNELERDRSASIEKRARHARIQRRNIRRRSDFAKC